MSKTIGRSSYHFCNVLAFKPSGNKGGHLEYTSLERNDIAKACLVVCLHFLQLHSGNACRGDVEIPSGWSLHKEHGESEPREATNSTIYPTVGGNLEGPEGFLSDLVFWLMSTLAVKLVPAAKEIHEAAATRVAILKQIQAQQGSRADQSEEITGESFEDKGESWFMHFLAVPQDWEISMKRSVTSALCDLRVGCLRPQPFNLHYNNDHHHDMAWHICLPYL
ncbi:hypothetical protein WISP_140522 [Willisornis vidua]|uniref:Uncharacterized protein n=1 Tax=Willisornis vidua TaxID=1566151 RepID=A0ABQ9CSI6_9PASS|nr:hypothetical protein WISP_140522 [Willisornis vidua]